jgi:ankyrin repeat protein
MAAFRGDIARMKQLLGEGANITERDEDGWGVLEFAAANAQYTTMRWLLTEAGASISEKENDTNCTVLTRSADMACITTRSQPC